MDDLDFKQLEKDYGSVIKKQKICFKQAPYLAHDASQDVYGPRDYYTALGVDQNGEEYRVYWKLLENGTDEPEHDCDWENPYRIEKI